PMVGLPAGVAKIEKETDKRKVKKVGKKAAKNGKQHAKRHNNKVSSSSKDRHSHAKKTFKKKASSPS
ncbi:hypothetical protein BGX24_007339, partial [Mortierella sp. AD032]